VVELSRKHHMASSTASLLARTLAKSQADDGAVVEGDPLTSVS
jgi:hypothetical protein